MEELPLDERVRNLENRYAELNASHASLRAGMAAVENNTTEILSIVRAAKMAAYALKWLGGLGIGGMAMYTGLKSFFH